MKISTRIITSMFSFPKKTNPEKKAKSADSALVWCIFIYIGNPPHTLEFFKWHKTNSLEQNNLVMDLTSPFKFI